MSKFETSLFYQSPRLITLFHDPDDPSTWIIRTWKKGLFGKRMDLSRWFNTKAQAEQYAQSLQEEFEKNARLHK
jgi:hypothetical protein